MPRGPLPHTVRTRGWRGRPGPCAAARCPALAAAGVARTFAGALPDRGVDHGPAAPPSESSDRRDKSTRAGGSIARALADALHGRTARRPAMSLRSSAPRVLVRAPPESALGSAPCACRSPVPPSGALMRSRRVFLFAESVVRCAPWVVTSFGNEPFLARNTHSYTGSPPEFQLTLALTPKS